jgi:V/A-type H+-transporting ATPase subunit I
MIVPMKKFTFLVHHKEYKSFLEDIQELGVLHVQQKGSGEIEDSGLREKYQIIYRLTNTIKFLEKRISKKNIEPQEKKLPQDLQVLDEIENLRYDAEMYQQKMQSVEKELTQVEPWGEFDRETIDQLAQNGTRVRFFLANNKQYDPAWEKDYNAFIISKQGSYLYFVTITPQQKEIDINAEKLPIPKHSPEELREEIDNIKGVLEKSNEIIDSYAGKYLNGLREARIRHQEEFEFNKVELSSEQVAENKVYILEGFVPAQEREKILNYLDSNSVYYIEKTPSPKERVPIMLKNNKFTRLFEPLGELYSLPKYNELDLTPYFAPFYMLFFGFCLGDAGYGILMIVVAGLVKAMGKAGNYRSVMHLTQFLGVSTFLFGVIGGTFFGINLYEAGLPVYRDLKQIFEAKGTDIDNIMFYLAIAIGAIQIVFGLFIKAANERVQGGWRNAFGTIGWIILIIGGGAVYAMNTLGALSQQAIDYSTYAVLSVAGVFILLLNSPEKNILFNIGAGLWDSYNMVTGLLGDLLSYIRLFALGISSAILGYVFNRLAVEMSGSIPVVSLLIMIVILLIGHGINIFMSGLGAFVHPMRLTFVEFYKNAGFEGGGKKYSPFKKQTKNKIEK